MQRKARDISSHARILFETEGSIRQLSSERKRGYYSGKASEPTKSTRTRRVTVFPATDYQEKPFMIVANQFINKMAGDLSPLEHLT